MPSVALAASPTAPPLPAPLSLPPPITPPVQPLNRLAFVASFVRNPLQIVPQAVYEQDFVPYGGRSPIVWVTQPDLIKAVLLDQRDIFRKIVQIRILGP